jgi:hypothetical protein
MARSKNKADTVTITLSTTPQIRDWLEALVADGFYGKNVAEAAERLIAEKIRELRGEKTLSAALRKFEKKKAANVETVPNLETP